MTEGNITAETGVSFLCAYVATQVVSIVSIVASCLVVTRDMDNCPDTANSEQKQNSEDHGAFPGFGFGRTLEVNCE